MNSDATLVSDKTKSFFVVKLGVVGEQSKLWKSFYGAVKPMIDYVATSQPELLNELKNCGFQFFYNESTYYDQVAAKIDKENLQVADLSSNMNEAHIESLSKSGVDSIAVESMEDARLVSSLNRNVRLILRVSTSDEVYDAGCNADDVISTIHSSVEESIPISSLCFLCPTAACARPVLEKITAIVAACSNDKCSLESIYIIGEGIQELAQLRDEASIELMTKLRELAESVTISVDASRFFVSHAYTIYTHIIGKKVKMIGDHKRILYYTDNGVYCSFFNAHIHHESIVPQPVFARQGAAEHSELIDSTIFGPTCDSIDNLGDDFKLPEMEVDDWFKYEGNGYRCSNFSARFNGFEDPDVYFS